MPRKVHQLKVDLKKAAFVEQKNRGKGSHMVREHPSGEAVTVAGHDGDDAQHYQERDVREAIQRARAR